jgi:2,5-diketo-D-gluconate reductase B
MSMLPLCKNGIPLLGFGTFPLKDQEAVEAVLMALDMGFRHIDTAQMYGNEAAVGAAFNLSSVKRSELYVVTKVDSPYLGETLFMPSVQRSVESLGDPCDLLLIHWPPADVDVLSTTDLLMEAKQKGLTKEIGVSNFSSELLRKVHQHTAGQIICNQVEFHPLLDQVKLLKAATELGVTLAAYCPLARGATLQNPVIRQIAERRQVSASQVVLRWITQQGVAAVPMTTKWVNAEANLAALNFDLSEIEMSSISAIGTTAGRVVAPEWMAGRW